MSRARGCLQSCLHLGSSRPLRSQRLDTESGPVSGGPLKNRRLDMELGVSISGAPEELKAGRGLGVYVLAAGWVGRVPGEAGVDGGQG